MISPALQIPWKPDHGVATGDLRTASAENPYQVPERRVQKPAVLSRGRGMATHSISKYLVVCHKLDLPV